MDSPYESDDTNLLAETLYELDQNGKSPVDVLYVTDDVNTCWWEDFARLAKDIDYDSGFGGYKINLKLKVVGANWWLERHEYDGSENWEYKERPRGNAPWGEVMIMEG